MANYFFKPNYALTYDRDAQIDFIINHFKYWKIRSWNELEVFANDVKLHHMDLGLDNEQIDRLYAALFEYDDTLYDTMIAMIRDFEQMYGVDVYFNGRLSGYLCMYDKTIEEFLEYDSHEDFCDTSDLDIKYCVDRLQSFDMLCDDLRETCIDYALHPENWE